LKNEISEIGFGGSCHWCTEAIFQSLIGVSNVRQGWITSDLQNENFSEAVILNFDSHIISLEVLIQIHLETHSCTANHSMRKKYRSAVYHTNENQQWAAVRILRNYQNNFKISIITQVIPLVDFKLNKIEQLNYYYTNPEKPFCQTRINPKLKMLLTKFASFVTNEKLSNLP
jgi:peptide-methionine (S)-S-oxide reductase